MFASIFYSYSIGLTPMQHLVCSFSLVSSQLSLVMALVFTCCANVMNELWIVASAH
uniref:Uncharacterized protein n=1 Tax=Arundo donax TaxID=35708 RepID=A0A0A8ZEU3_ARUDO